MGEPVTLIGKDGKLVTVYGAAQAAELLAQGYNHSVDPELEPIAEDDRPAALKRTPNKRPVKSGK